MQAVIDMYKTNGGKLTNELLYEYYCAKFDLLYGSTTEEQYRIKNEFGTNIFNRHTKVSFPEFCYSRLRYIEMGLPFNHERIMAEIETYIKSTEKTASPLYQE